MNIEINGLKMLVIGGEGSYGTWWAQGFKGLGCEVRIITKETPRKEIIKLFHWATLVWSAAPYEATMEYLADFAPVMTAEQGFVNTSSLQGVDVGVLKRMKAKYVGVHVLSDVPKGAYFADETIVWCHLDNRLEKFDELIKSLLQRFHAKRVHKIKLQEHDEIILWETMLPRTIIFLMGLILFAMNVDLKKLALFQTKFGRVVYGALRRFLTQSNEIEAEVLIENPRSTVVIDAAIRFLFILRIAIRNKDKQGIVRLKQDMKDYFGKEFLEETKD